MERSTYLGLARPNFMADPSSAIRNSGRQINWDNVPNTFRERPAFAAVSAVISAAAATAWTVAALTAAVKKGDRFINAAGTKQLQVSADTAAGAVSVPVYALAEATADTEVYNFIGEGDKIVKAGQPMAMEASGGKMVPRTASLPAFGLLEGPAVENDTNAALTGYGVIVGGVVFEQLVPEISSTIKTELETNGAAFYWETYADTRAS